MERITSSSVNSAVALKQFAASTGISIEALQQWEYWADKNNIEAGAMAQMFKQLQTVQAQMRSGGAAPAGAKFFNIDMNKNPLEVWNQIHQKIRAIGNDEKQIGMARTMFASLGISDQLFGAARAGEGMQGFTKDMMLTGKEMNKLLSLNRKWVDFWNIIKGTTKKTIANDLAGPITDFVGTLQNAVKQIAEFVKMIKKSLSSLGEGEMLALKGLLLGIGAAIAPWSAALVAVAGALDQIYKYTHGEKSIFDVFKKINSKEDAAGLIADKVSGYAVSKNNAPKELMVMAHMTEFFSKMLGMSGRTSQTNYFNITGVKEARETAEMVQKMILDATFQNKQIARK